jgi:hypothetical protein
MADESAAGDRKLKVFISYSRNDEDFAQELLAGLGWTIPLGCKTVTQFAASCAAMLGSAFRATSDRRPA